MLGKIGAWRHVVVGVFDRRDGAARGHRRDRPRPPRRAFRIEGRHRRTGRRRRRAHPRGGRRGLRHQRTATATSGSFPQTSASRPTSRRHRPMPTPTSTSPRSADGDRIRLGDPDTTFTGQHRYVLAYTLPERPAVDRPARARHHRYPDETLETDRFEVVVNGLELDDPTCNVGDSAGTSGAARSNATATCIARSSVR